PHSRRPRAAAAALLLTFACAVTGCSSGNAAPEVSGSGSGSSSGSGSGAGTGAGQSSNAASSTAAKSGSASPSASSLTPMQLAGQRVIYSYAGLTPPSSLLKLIREGEVGGVIFFSPNISSASQLAGVVKTLEAAQEQSPVHLPLLLMTDQEGGEIRRIAGGQPTDSEKQIGASSDVVQAASQAGSGAAGTLKSAGLNMNLAPVLDVFSSPGDFDDQFGRSYSSDPTVVSAAGSAFITAQQADGVAATAKHFPGLGTAPTSADTDFEPVTLNASLDRLRSVDEEPYKAAIAAGVDVVMVSWAVYPVLDDRPAGLSSVVVQQELRDRLGFKGVTVTDALEAGALKAYGGPGTRAVDAALAGMDLIMCSEQNPTQGEQATEALAAALQDGKLGSSGFDAAVNRLWALRQKLS
ncbi:beta-N-acetylhexosaminidase, partial [Actinospica durhamensis]